MNVCDIGVLSTFGEGISNALMEFMALGIPVVATDAGGTVELIEHNVSGCLISLSNPKQLAESIVRLVDNKSERVRLGSHAKATIRSKFGFEEMVDSFYTEYKNIVA